MAIILSSVNQVYVINMIKQELDERAKYCMLLDLQIIYIRCHDDKQNSLGEKSKIF